MATGHRPPRHRTPDHR